MTWTKGLAGQPGFTPAQKHAIHQLAAHRCQCPGCPRCARPSVILHAATQPGLPPRCEMPSTQADHITPRHLGGTNDLSNGQALCEPCHWWKTEQERKAALKRTTDKLKHPSARR